MQGATALAAGGNGGDSECESESKIIKRHTKRIRWVAIPFASRGVHLDDLVQEGCMALIEAARKWDPTKGASLWTYARRFVFGAIFKFVARELNEPASDLQLVEESGEEDAYDSILCSDGPTPEEVAVLGEDLKILEEEIDALTNEERLVLWSVFGQDKSLRDVERDEGSSHGSTLRLYKGAIETLRERMAARS